MSFHYDRRALRRLLKDQDLDALAAETRLNRRTLWYLQRGVTEPKASTLARLATALGVEPNAFYFRKDDAA